MIEKNPSPMDRAMFPPADPNEPGTDIEIEIPDGLDPTEFGLDAPEEDGPAMPAEIPHTENLASYLSENALRKLSEDLKLAVQSDDMARKEWLEQMQQGLQLLGFTFEEVSEPWQGAAAATHPLLAKAVVSFQSRSIKTLFPPAGPVQGKARGKSTPLKLNAVARVVEEMNARLTEHQDYRDELEKALFMCGLTGSGFVKTWYSQAYRRPMCMSVSPAHVILSPDATNVDVAMRVTHVLRRSLAEITYDQSKGVYRECDLEEGDAQTGTMAYDQTNDVDEAKDKISGIDGWKDQRLVLHEVQTRLNLAEYDEKTKIDADSEWGSLPYIVTYDTHSMEVLSIYRNWQEDDTECLPLQRFTQYLYLVSDLSPYGLGLVHLVGQTTATTTATLRNLLDSGTLSNLQGGFKTRGLRIKGDTEGFRPGEYRDVDIASGSLRDNMVPHNFKEPSATLLALMQDMNARGEELATVASASLDDIPHNAASFAVLAVLERELEPQAAVHVRLHAALKRQLGMFATIVRDKLPENYDYDTQDGDGAQPGLRRSDFSMTEITPVSNPNEASAGAKLLKMQVLSQMVGQFPEQFDKDEFVRYSVNLLGEPDFQALLAKNEPPPSLDPLSENVQFLLGKPVKVYPEQDHEAHLRVHMAAMQDPKIMALVQQSPNAQTLMMAAQAHMAEHTALAYRRAVEREMGIMLPPVGQPMDPEAQNRLANLTAEASERVLGLHQKIESLKQAQDPIAQMQMLDVQNKKRALDIDEQDRTAKRSLDQAKLQIEAHAQGLELTFKGMEVALAAAQAAQAASESDPATDSAHRRALAETDLAHKHTLSARDAEHKRKLTEENQKHKQNSEARAAEMPSVSPAPPPKPEPSVPPALVSAMTSMASAVAAIASRPEPKPVENPPAAAPNITVNVPAQAAPVVNVDVQVPKPDTPNINVTAPVTVEMPHPSKMEQNVVRDSSGEIAKTITTYEMPPRKPRK